MWRTMMDYAEQALLAQVSNKPNKRHTIEQTNIS
jgi:hypothetical protein